MAAATKKLPLESSSTFNAAPGDAPATQPQPAGKRSIEEIYQKKTQLEHILLRPDTYVGSIEKHSQTLWVYEGGEMVRREVSYVPGLYKIFDEILVNAADNKQRDPSMDSLKVEIDAEANRISVYNSGDGVPVEIHQEEGIYVPEMIFGHLLTSSNYDDNVKKTTGGRNGYGAKLTNIFSTEFIIETADGKRHKKYKQVFSENMGKKSEPSITKCKEGENWTKVTFKPDLAKFKMTHLEDDVVALMKKRVVDLAGIFGKSVKVELNGQRLNLKSFSDYVNLYLRSLEKTREEPLPRITEKVGTRWEICVSLSEGQFQQVSYVNSIATIKGGTHVEYITNQIASHIIDVVHKKNKNTNLKAHNVKSHLWVFVNALIDNPAFDSQTKETLTTRQGSFGSKCELSPEFLKKVAKSEIVDSVLSWADFKQSKELKKTDGSKRQRIHIPKLEDANDAGGRNSEKCTLILTEGDSAKALAMSGISVVGRDHYGVFPLRGKLLNVREASVKQITENAEIQNLKKILGLQQGKAYENTKDLRYGHLMIMTDQDHDGSHIKGLLINFFHLYWPSLLRVPSFMVEFITPIIRARKNKTVLSFYSMPEYEVWKESLGGNAKGWQIKYYKGLGTSQPSEGKEYFHAIDKHKKDFKWEDDNDGEAIELAFSKKKIEARKNWLRQFEPGTHLDSSQKIIKYSEFINKELILFSMADLQRSIPSMVDGLKPGQRKILFCSFKRNLVREIKVQQLQGYVAEHSAYHHGDQSLISTIIGMAQDFIGSNNIHLLMPKGQFGTRHQGGKDHASGRYIFTELSPLSRFLFPKQDDILLNYLNEDGLSIEPVWYVPIIPMVLVNGSEGIGTGWSSYVPNYNPKDIIANIRRLLNDELMVPMDPWYKGFKGLIEKSATKETGLTYTIRGIIEQLDDERLRISELPIRKWTQDYKEFLQSLMTTADKKEPFIKDYREQGDENSVDIEIALGQNMMDIALQEGLEKKFKLTSSIGTTNMHLFDHNGVIKKYDTPEHILEDFFHLRYEFYEKRKKTHLEILEVELRKLANKVRFILGVVNGDIIVNNRKKADLLFELQHKGFAPFPKKSKDIEVAGATLDSEDASPAEEDGLESPEAAAKVGVKASDYDYLLSMGIGSLTKEKIEELCAEKDKLDNEVDTLKKTSPKELWLMDLDALEVAIDEFERNAEAENQKVKLERRTAAARPAPKKPRKVAAKSLSSNEPEDAAAAPGNRKSKAVPKKAPTKKKPTIVDSDEDEEILDLKERLASYNLDSSPEQNAAMETDVAAAAKPPPTAVDLSDNDDNGDHQMPAIDEDDDDEEFKPVEAPAAAKRGGGNARGKKAAAVNDKANKVAAPRKRGPALKSSKSAAGLNQKLITEVFQPAENAAATGISPQKKVRKIRASPFNKKSGSMLGGKNKKKIIEEDSDSDSEEESPEMIKAAAAAAAAAPSNRPKRENRTRAVYVLSDSETEDDPVVSAAAADDSDFLED